MFSKFYLIVSFLITLSSFSQQSVKIHSHNDYYQQFPFWKAYNNGLNSIEIDVFYKNDSLFVAHEEKEIDVVKTFETLYLKPLKKVFSQKSANHREIQILIDSKTEAYTTLDAIIKVLQNYPELTSNPKIKFVISGARPNIEDYNKYPNFIFFDYQSLDPIPEEYYQKIALISLSFRKYSSWDGVKKLSISDLKKITTVIKKAHSLQKPFRFWATPDTKLVWKTLFELGLDFINTDQPLECSHYFTNKIISD